MKTMSTIKGFQDMIDWYNENASVYAAITADHAENASLFTSLLIGKKILDAGCGAGHDTNMFMKLGYDAVGVDISPNLIAEAKQRYPKARFINEDFRSLSFEKETFDGIWSQASLLHFESEDDVRQSLREFHRILKPYGVLYVYVKKQMGEEKTETYEDTLTKKDRFFRYFTEAEMKRYFEEAGFSIIKMEIHKDDHGRKEVKWIMVLGRKK